MDKLLTGARVLYGLVFFIFGLNGALHFTNGSGFIPMPPPKAEMAAIMDGFLATKYLMLTVKYIEVVAGFLLLINLLVPFALIILAPIVFNIVAIHYFVEPDGLIMSAVILGLQIILMLKHKKSFLPLLKFKA